MNTPTNKKAVHVKWAGKTIALGTFPLAEADEKCARAKALTRAWRSTMRPKPSREWVMTELERLNVRVVSGRPSKETQSDEEGNESNAAPVNNNNGNANDMQQQGNQSAITASLLNAAEIARGYGLDSTSFLSQSRRNSSLAMSLLDDGRDSNIAAVAAAAMGKNELDSVTGVPHHRPLVGGGSAAAYEAARADHYRKLAEQKNKPLREKIDVNERGANGAQIPLPGNARRLSSLGGLMNGDSSSSRLADFNPAPASGSSGGNSLGLSVNPNAHYEMLKLHHMNLLNEIQETTLMMNLYQQQQLQQQQQQKKIQQQQQLLVQQQQQQVHQHLLGQTMGRSNSMGLGSGTAPRSNSMGLGSGLGNYNHNARNMTAASQAPLPTDRNDVISGSTNRFSSKKTAETAPDRSQQQQVQQQQQQAHEESAKKCCCNS
jgi:hypothetical protein